MSDPDPEVEAPPDGAWLDAHLAVYLRDPSLWPVAIVAFSIAVTLLAALLAAAALTRNPMLWGAVGLLALGSLDVLQREVRGRRRLGPSAGALLLLWLASVLAALLARFFGWI